ncbi:FAD-binding protein [Euzebya sp.]|uniref:FAD-binding protein n=1 Tax=Euzebya sp. TaxID=1971409 RepID=UPI003512D942
MTRHAVVLGAGIAGLAAATTLAARHDRVTVVDRDTAPTGPTARDGVPQGRHIHLLVPGGLQRLESLLPDIADDLAAAGAGIIPAPEWRFHMGGGRVAARDPSLRITGATRPLLEQVVRDRVRALERVDLLQGWSARDLVTTDDRATVTGVRLQSEADPAQERHLDADLVVDATGRGSAAPRWLADLGYTPPTEERLSVGVHYTTRLFDRDPADLGGARNVLVDIPPGQRRGGVALAVEGDRWLVTLMGMLGERPPADLEGFAAYAGSLWVDDLHRIVDGATPVSEPARHAFPAFAWNRYDRLDRMPGSFAVLGDAVCSFDPRFGQGMAVGIAEAIALGEVLDAHGPATVGPRLAEASLPVVQDAWDLSSGAVLAHPEVEGPRPLAWKATTAYLQHVLPVAHRDPEVADALIRVIGLVDRPQALMHPRTMWRVLSGSLGRDAAPSAAA